MWDRYHPLWKLIAPVCVYTLSLCKAELWSDKIEAYTMLGLDMNGYWGRCPFPHNAVSETFLSTVCVTQDLDPNLPSGFAHWTDFHLQWLGLELNFQLVKIFTEDLASSGHLSFQQCPLEVCICLVCEEGISSFPPTGAPGRWDIPGGQ